MSMAEVRLPESKSRETFAERVFQVGAVLGAACGALVGVNLAGEYVAWSVAEPLLGVAGTVVGSFTCALAARFLVYPVWAALLFGPRRT
jgi:hypothetical protein